jgi:sugar phosphate isomerase/epimerase
MQYVLFTDNLADLSIEEVCRRVKAAGFDGLDLTLRPGGHVKPERAEAGMAQARAIADDQGVTIPMVSTSVTSVEDPHAEAVFAAAAHYGARLIKLGYWRYEPFGTLARQLDETREKLQGLVELGRRYHVKPCLHAHSGRILTGAGPLLYLLLKDFKPGDVGAYVDPMHMTVEGGNAGWEMGLDLLGPWVALVGIKNFRWIATERDSRGQQRYQTQYTPLADGQAPLPEFMDYLKQLRYDGVVSLHSEYKGGSSFRRLTTDQLLVQSAEDLRYLKSLVGG